MTSKQVRLIFGSGVFALLLFYCAAGFYIWFYPPGSDGAWHGRGSFCEVYITKGDPQSPAQDFRPGDKIIAVNGVKVAGKTGVLGSQYPQPAGPRYPT